MTITEVQSLREKEDKVELKEAVNTFSFEGGDKADFRKRRKCILGYVVALANEGGGKVIFGVKESEPKHKIVGTVLYEDKEGALEQRIYERLKIRVTIEVLFDSDSKRVLIIHVPSRPIGKVYTFEDTPLMRVGDQLERMSDEEYFKAINEQEPDFSSTLCKGLTIEGLSDIAIQKMKQAYSRKQKNPNFLTLSNEQVLSDLELMENGLLNFAALILLGERKTIQRLLPQAAVHLEYRNKKGQIVFDKRDFFRGGYFLETDSLWNSIDSRNGAIPVQQGPYIFDIPYFNQEVIREAINNAIAHRDYRINGEIVIKQYPNHLEIINPGGFPKGVNLNNLLTVNSTPRNRRLAEVLSKTGVVERSGQGIDKIYFQSLAEAKGQPDYSKSDDFQVELHLPGIVKDKAFALFISYIQENKQLEERLSVQEIMVLEQVRVGADKNRMDKDSVHRLVHEGYVEKIGRTNSQRYRLSKEYFEFVNKKGEYTINSPLDSAQIGILISNHLQEFGEARMSDFIQLLKSFHTKDQVKYLIYKMADSGFLERKGKGSGTKYILSEKIERGQQMMARAVQLGIEEMIKRGEMSLNKD